MRAALVFLGAAILASCATARGRTGPLPALDPLSALGTAADCYVVLPVDGNGRLIELLADGATSGTTSGPGDANGKSVKRLTGRTRIVYAALNGDSAPDAEDTTPRVRVDLLAFGNYPRCLAPLAFPASKGWSRTKSENAVWYSRAGLSVSVRKGGLAFATTGDPRSRAFPDPSAAPAAVSPRFSGVARSGEYPLPRAERPANGTAGQPDAPDRPLFAVFVNKPSLLVSRALGPDISAPVESVELYGYPGTSDGSYIIRSVVTAPSARAALALRALAGIALGVGATVSGRDVLLEDVPASAAKLAEFARFLYVRE